MLIQIHLSNIDDETAELIVTESFALMPEQQARETMKVLDIMFKELGALQPDMFVKHLQLFPVNHETGNFFEEYKRPDGTPILSDELEEYAKTKNADQVDQEQLNAAEAEETAAIVRDYENDDKKIPIKTEWRQNDRGQWLAKEIFKGDDNE